MNICLTWPRWVDTTTHKNCWNYTDDIWMKFILKGPINNKSSLDEVMVWYQIGDERAPFAYFISYPHSTIVALEIITWNLTNSNILFLKKFQPGICFHKIIEMFIKCELNIEFDSPQKSRFIVRFNLMQIEIIRNWFVKQLISRVWFHIFALKNFPILIHSCHFTFMMLTNTWLTYYWYDQVYNWCNVTCIISVGRT